MDLLRRALAPIVDDAWKEIEHETRRVLLANLSGRRVIDVVGPKGWDYPAVNLGRIGDEKADANGVRYGLRRVQPLVEVRIPFSLSIDELDNVARGADDPDLEAAVEAAQKAAHFEEHAIYRGFEPGGIVGLQNSIEHQPLPLGQDPANYPKAVAQAITVLQDAGVEGPYRLVLGPAPFRNLAAVASTYPPHKQITSLTGGPVIYSPVLDGGLLVSIRGGDFELVLGQDFALGYHSHDGTKVNLYLVESLTFRVLGPEAALRLPIG